MPVMEYLASGYHIDRYYVLEEDFLKFLRFLPLEFYPEYEHRLKIRSTYLADLLLRIGSNIDIFFRKYIITYHEIAEKAGIQKEADKLSISDYKKLEPYLKLGNADVIINPISHLSDRLYPFRLRGELSGKAWDEVTGSNDPNFWWRSYQEVKHNGIFDRANLDNVLQSLASLIILISYHPHIQKLEQYSYLKIKPECELFCSPPRYHYPPSSCFINTRLFYIERLLDPGTMPPD